MPIINLLSMDVTMLMRSMDQHIGKDYVVLLSSVPKSIGSTLIEKEAHSYFRIDNVALSHSTRYLTHLDAIFGEHSCSQNSFKSPETM
jgi:hypothetical protein